MTHIAIEAKDLCRCFGTKPVVQNVSFQIPVGSVVGLLGLNGAGKSTTIKMLMGLLEPTRGSCSVLGVESMQFSAADRVRIGYTIEGHFLYSSLTARQAEQLQCDTFPKWNASIYQATLDRFGISPQDRIRELSRGQRAGLSIALTLSAQPEVLILDDPALGLDPVSRRTLNETILEFVGSGERTVLLSSHLLDDIERVTDRILIMLHGQIVVDCSVSRLLERVSTWSGECHDNSTKAVVPGLISQRRIDNRILWTVLDADEETEQALRRIAGDSIERVPVAFDECVLAYLSSARSSVSLLSASSSIR
jgi:ABC-2 type transport system ATP-binding protein